MYRLAFKNFIRSKSVIAALIFYVIIGIVSIIIGNQFLQKQQKAIASVTQSQKEHILLNTSYIKDEFGLLMYYLKFAYINKPTPLTALAIGQQDVNTTIQSLTIRGLEAQRYDTDLYNPYHLMTGNFDFSFVIIFLFPLLIIAFCFNLLSEEKENGTWKLVSVQAKKPLQYLLQKIGIRYAVVIAVLVLLLVLATFIIGIPVHAAFLAYTITSFLYITVWFAICFFIIALQKNTSNNALLLLSIWLILCLLTPALINNYITAKYPVKEAYSTLIKQRDGYHTKWDKNKDTTMAAFYGIYPQYKNYKWTKPTFDYLWYYAMQHLGDAEAALDTKAMQQKLQQRQKASTTASLFFLPMHSQLQLSNIANTDMATHLRYLDSTAAFHEKLRHHFYPKIFGDSAVVGEDWAKQVPQYFKKTNHYTLYIAIIPYLITLIILIVTSLFFFRKNVNP